MAHYDGYLINFSSSNGYPSIFVNGKNVLLHRYVWEKHFGKIPKGYEVHHKNKDRLDYSVGNLELIKTEEHHRKHAIENGLGKSNKGKPKKHVSGFCAKIHPVTAIKGNEKIQFESMSAAVKKLNVSNGEIWRILHGKRKTAKGWYFVNG